MSTTLKIPSHEGDAALVNNFEYFQGLEDSKYSVDS